MGASSSTEGPSIPRETAAALLKQHRETKAKEEQRLKKLAEIFMKIAWDSNVPERMTIVVEHGRTFVQYEHSFEWLLSVDDLRNPLFLRKIKYRFRDTWIPEIMLSTVSDARIVTLRVKAPCYPNFCD